MHVVVDVELDCKKFLVLKAKEDRLPLYLLQLGIQIIGAETCVSQSPPDTELPMDFSTMGALQTLSLVDALLDLCYEHSIHEDRYSE